MLTQILVRFALGGAIVCFFAALGDMLKPKSFAGLFGAAPSVALATILLTVEKQGRAYASLEARSMILGAVAFFAYAWIVFRLLLWGKWPALLVAVSSLAIWLGCALGLWRALLG